MILYQRIKKMSGKIKVFFFFNKKNIVKIKICMLKINLEPDIFIRQSNCFGYLAQPLSGAYIH